MDDAVLLLVGLATLEDPDVARFGADAIFRKVVEGLGDAFDPKLCDLYIRFCARLLDDCRRLPAARWLDERLVQFGLRSEEDLVCRATALRRIRAVPSHLSKIIMLSRVTLGAEVAVTSVVLQKMMRRFPGAELVLLAGERASLLFAGERRITVRAIRYPRGGGLLERLAAWPVVVDAVAQEIGGLAAGEYLIVDPDSRLTQLGMLPLVHRDAGYHFFESRSYSKAGAETLSELTAAWLDECFGADAEPARPAVWLPAQAVDFARALRGAATSSNTGRDRWVSINLGVGDNAAKRIADPFEQRLLARLLSRGWRIFLDKGDGVEELARACALLARLREAGCAVAEITENTALPDVRSASIIAWRGSLAGFGAIIGQSDLYIGYDSACQHLAAALGVKVIDIFAGFRSPMVPRRWTPTGTAAVKTILVDPHTPADPEKILNEVLEAAR